MSDIRGHIDRALDVTHIETYSFSDVNLNDTLTVNHSVDNDNHRQVMVKELLPGAGYTDNSLDFDTSDAAFFIQESLTGTSFVDGKIQLYDGGNNYSLTTATDTGDILSVGDYTVFCMTFKIDGTRVYHVNGTTIYQRDLPAPWDISSQTYAGGYAITGLDSTNYSVHFKPDGTRFYLANENNNRVAQFNMSTPWDITTATAGGTFTISTYNPYGLTFNSDGTKMYIGMLNTDTVYQYTLDTPWDITTLQTGLTVTYYAGASLQSIGGIDFNNTGTKMFLLDWHVGAIKQYSLSGAWDITTATYDNIARSIGASLDFKFSTDGEYLIRLGTGGSAASGKLFKWNTKETVYDTLEPSYVSTSDTNHISLSSATEISSIIIYNDQPVNTSIRGLVSFDGRNTWKFWNGSAWVNSGITDIDTYDFNHGGTPVYKGTGFASQSHGTYPPVNLTDDDTATFWSTNNGITSTTEYFGSVFDGIVNLESLDLYSRFASLMPKNFSIEISSDTTDGHDGNWEQILSNQNFTNGDEAWQNYPFNETVQCKAVKIVSQTSLYSNGYYYIQVKEMSFNGLQADNSIDEIHSGMTGYEVSQNDTHLDFVFDLSTTDSTVTPTIDLIVINYTEGGVYRIKNVEDYSVEETDITTTVIQKLTSGPHNVKVSIVL